MTTKPTVPNRIRLQICRLGIVTLVLASASPDRILAESTPVPATSTELKVPPASDADKIRLTPGFVAAVLIETSDIAALIKNDFINIDSSKLKFDAAFSGKIDSKISYFDDRNEPAQSISPTRNKVTQVNVGFSRQFTTGTTFRTELQHQQRFPEGLNPMFLAEGYENDLSVSIRQALVKNAFGTADSKREESTALLRDAARHATTDRLQKVAIDGIGLYFQAWLAQWQVRASEARLDRQQQLLKITKINARRGTAENADVMQLEAAVILSQNSLDEARKNIVDLWRQLILSLKLPREYLEIDPMRVTLDPGRHLTQATTVCRSGVPDNTDRIKALALSVKAANLNQDATKSALRPDVFIEARLSGNGLDRDVDKIWDETLAMKHPQTTVALGIEIPTSFNREKADFLDALRQKMNAEVQMAQARTQFEINQDQYCREWQVLTDKLNGLKKALELQVNREKAEQKRFRIGKVDAFSVIRAGNDITDTEMALRSTDARLHMTAWKLLYESGQLNDQLMESLKAGMTK